MRPALDQARCLQVRRLYSVALDGEAACEEMLAAALHIADCEPCHRFAAQVAVITGELRSARLRLGGSDRGHLTRGETP